MILKKYIILIIIIMLMNITYADSKSYALATGKADYTRLQYLNEAVNPYSISFLKKYINRGNKVLDIGCGPGLLSEKIAELVGDTGEVYAIDISKAQIDLARERQQSNNIKNVHYYVMDAMSLSALKPKFDVVYIRFALIHLRDPYSVAKQVKQVLKPGGYLLIEELAGNDTIVSIPKDVRLDLVKKVDSLQEEVQQTNFAIGLTYGDFLANNGFMVMSNKFVHPKLDTLNKRQNFSLGMESLTDTLVKHKKITKSELTKMIGQVKEMEADLDIDLYFYKMGQLAVVYLENLP